jgi:hypothetical protein
MRSNNYNSEYTRGSQTGCRGTLGYRELKFRVQQKYLKYIYFFKRLHEKYSTVQWRTPGGSGCRLTPLREFVDD